VFLSICQKRKWEETALGVVFKEKTLFKGTSFHLTYLTNAFVKFDKPIPYIIHI